MAIADWLDVSPTSGTGGGSVSVKTGDNSQGSYRSSSFTVKTASGLSRSVNAYQFGKSVWERLIFYKENNKWYCDYYSNFKTVYPDAYLLKYVEVEIETTTGDTGYLTLQVGVEDNYFEKVQVTGAQNIELLENFKNLTGDAVRVWWDTEEGEEWGDHNVQDSNFYCLSKTSRLSMVMSIKSYSSAKATVQFAVIAEGNTEIVNRYIQLPAQSFPANDGSGTVTLSQTSYRIDKQESISHRITSWVTGSGTVNPSAWFTKHLSFGVSGGELYDNFYLKWASEGIYTPFDSGLGTTNNYLYYRDSDYNQTDTNISLTMRSVYPVASKVSGTITTEVGRTDTPYSFSIGSTSAPRTSITIESESADSIRDVTVDSPTKDTYYAYIAYQGDLYI